jgi:hypothetical protein
MADPLDPIRGIGLYVWELNACEGGNVDAITRRLKNAHVAWVAIKAADGAAAFPGWTAALVAQIKAAGIRCLGWHYIYGSADGQPAGEIAAAYQALGAQPDGWIIDSEADIEQLGHAGATSAANYCVALRSAFPHIPLYLSSFPITTLHPGQPYEIYRQYCAAWLPQLYWHTLERSPLDAAAWMETAILSDPRVRGWACAPTGQVYDVTAADVDAFALIAARNWPDVGVSWWSYQHVTGADQWAVLAAARATYARQTAPASEPQDFIMTTAQHLRQFPAVWPVDGPLLPVGTHVTGTGELTTHWRQVRTAGGQTGWVLRSNTRAVPARPVQDFIMTTAQHLRRLPIVWPVTGPLLPVGTRVKGTGRLTTHWRQVRTAGGQTGWVLRSNTRAVTATPVAAIP